MPLRGGLLESRQQLRDKFIGELLTITGDTRRLWLPKPTDATTSIDESKNGATLTHAATIAGRLSALGLGYAASFNGTTDYSSFPDAADLSFGTGSADLSFSVISLSNVTDTAVGRQIISKSDTGQQEWQFLVTTADTLRLTLQDQSAAVSALTTSNAAITQGSPHLFAGTYSGVGGATAADGIALYQDGVVMASTATNNVSYVAMENGTAPVEIGSTTAHTTQLFGGSQAMDLICAGALSASQVWAVWKLCKSYFAL